VFQNSDIEVVDFDPKVRKAVESSTYRKEFFQKWANKLVANDENFSRFKNTEKDKESKHARAQLKKLLANMPLKLSDLIKSGLSVDVKTTYFETHNPGNYDYIIATKSFIYPLSREDMSLEQQSELISKYLHALRDGGRMYVDYQTAFVLIEEGLVDKSAFEFHVIEHKTSYLNPIDCADKVHFPEADFMGCILADGTRISTTEDIIVIQRKVVNTFSE
jgi:hypothetical protein